MRCLSHHRRQLVFTISTLLLIASDGLLSRSRLVAETHPNVVIILVDDMGYGDAGCYNPDSRIRTPHIDSVASVGMRFTDAHASGPLCHMSRYGLMTGRYPFRTQIGQWPQHALIESEQTTLASLLKKQGYRTAMVGKWHLGFEENGYDQPLPGGPVDVGFDSYFGIRASTDIPPYFYIRDNRAVAPPTIPIAANNTEGWSPIQGAFWRAGLIAPDLHLPDVLPRFTEEAIQVIQQHATEMANSTARKPLFLYVAYPAPHTPWLPSEPFTGKSQVGLYGDFTEMVDAMIGRVLQSLESAGLSKDTLLIVASDNGPTWYDADVERFQHDSSGGWRGMKADAWEAGHRIPFVVRWPGEVAPGTVSHQTICFTDVLATLATITGYELREQDGPDSFDFSHELRGTQPPDQPVRPALALQSGSGFKTFRQGHWKLIQGLGSGGFSEPKRLQPEPGGPTVQLYNLAEDPAEMNNLALDRPEIVARLTRRLNTIERAGRHRD